MPRTEYRKKPVIRYCRDCGYELALDNDGPCPMCPRLEQLRLNLAVPRPNDFGAYPANGRDTHGSAAPDEWRPTVAEYRAMLAERGVGSTDESRGRVIRTPVLRQTRVPHPPRAAQAADDAALAPPRTAPASGKRTIPDVAQEGEGTNGQAWWPASDEQLGGSAETSRSSERWSGAAKSAPAPSPPARPLTQAAPVRRVRSRSRCGATRAWLVPVAVVAVSGLIGLAVPILLSSF